MDLLQSMALPFIACLVLTGMHAYMGFHVISRKVIFVDLALAQIAAFGVAYAALLNYEIGNPADSTAIYMFSLTFTFIGAAVFALTRIRHERIPHEAIIGIIYAVASAATILATVNLGHGAEQVKNLLTGSILWLRASTVWKTVFIYSLVGMFHYMFRKQFLLISTDPARAEAQGLNLRWWDFLFYMSFGFVITSSVSIAGVLLVFSYLVVPPTIAILYSETLRGRLAIGWATGAVVSLIGIIWAYEADLPAGPAIVATFGIALLLAGLMRYLLLARSRIRSLGYLLAGFLVVGGFLWISQGLRKPVTHDVSALLGSPLRNERLLGIHQAEEIFQKGTDLTGSLLPLLKDTDPEVRMEVVHSLTNLNWRAAEPRIRALLTDPQDRVREAAIRSLRVLGNPQSIPSLLRAADRELDDYLRTEIGETMLELGDPRGIPILLQVMESAPASQARRDAFEHLSAHIQAEMPFDASLTGEENRGQLRPWHSWWEKYGSRLRWDRQDGLFHPQP